MSDTCHYYRLAVSNTVRGVSLLFLKNYKQRDTIKEMKNYRLESQYKLINYIGKQIYKVSPNKVNRPSSLTVIEEEAVAKRVMKKYDLSKEHIHSYLDNNGNWGFNYKDLLSFFLALDGDLDKYDFYITKQNAKSSLHFYFLSLLFSLLPTLAFYVVCALTVRNLVGFIVMGAVGIVMIPTIIYFLVKYLRDFGFIYKNACFNKNKVGKGKIIKVHYSFDAAFKYNRAYYLHGLLIVCDVDGNKNKYIYYPNNEFAAFPRKHFFYFVKVIRKLNKALKGKEIPIETIEGTNVICGYNRSIEHSFALSNKSLE